MLAKWRRFVIVPGLLAMLAVACSPDGGPDSESLIGPEPVAAADTTGDPQALLWWLWPRRDRDSDREEYTLIREELSLGGLLSDVLSLKVTKLIGYEGGELTLAGHTLTVPRGAVRSPTLFVLELLPTGYIEVDLTAMQLLNRLLGGLLNVTEFRRDPVIEMTYSRATNLPEDLDRLLIVYAPGLLGYRDLEPLESEVDEERQVVRAKLPHFSRFCMAAN